MKILKGMIKINKYFLIFDLDAVATKDMFQEVPNQ